MTVVAAAFAGAGIGLGILLLVRALHPRPVPLAAALHNLEQPRRPITEPDPTVPTGRRSIRRIRATAVGVLEATGLVDLGALGRRLRVLDKTIEQHATDKLSAGIVGMLLPVLLAVALGVAGFAVPPVLTILSAVGFGIAGYMWPDLRLSEQVDQRRRVFRHCLSAYLDLVTIILAGGGGLETALHTAADLGDGWPFTEIRSALNTARVTNRTPWEVFDQLGTELGVDELRELAASAHLAGDQGARIRVSLAAKADSMRTAQTAAIEAQAEAVTEKMLLPVVTLVVGMILFIGFGVVQAISTPGALP